MAVESKRAGNSCDQLTWSVPDQYIVVVPELGISLNFFNASRFPDDGTFRCLSIRNHITGLLVFCDIEDDGTITRGSLNEAPSPDDLLLEPVLAYTDPMKSDNCRQVPSGREAGGGGFKVGMRPRDYEPLLGSSFTLNF